ncbi:MAG: GTP 3',8-cyclase MoaA, partial [Pseudomonadota bacterium]
MTVPSLIDPFQRKISYLRVSVTDRCDFRCVYCMSEHMTFLPKRDLLSLEELDRLCSVFIGQGVRKLRITGGEPLVRKNIMWFFERMGRHLGAKGDAGGLDELTVTTNGSQLKRHAQALADCGVKRVNVSLDTLDEAKFQAITRWGRLAQVLEGIEAAHAAGLRVKINVVALKGTNDTEIHRLLEWCDALGMDLTFIEVMPMGDLGGEDRLDQYYSLKELRRDLSERWTLTETDFRTGGPAR